MPMSVSVDESWDADESSVSGWRNVKRRRVATRSLDILDDEDDSQRTAVEEDFEMLDGPQSLPWVPVNPASQHSEYVPPGLNALIDGAFPILPAVPRNSMRAPGMTLIT